MRILLIIITLLGVGTFGYSLTGRVHDMDSRTDFLQILSPKEGSRLPKQQQEILLQQLDALESVHQNDWQVVRMLGGAMFLLGFSALICDRRKHGSRSSA